MTYKKLFVQCVSALGEISEQLAVIFGVPQGSCLGPLLFIININYISNICNSNELIVFADDTNIFVKAKSKHEVYIEANIILKQLSIYNMLNKLHVLCISTKLLAVLLIMTMIEISKL